MTRDGEIVEFRSALEAAIASFCVGPLSERQYEQLTGHYKMLCAWNRRVNLTRIVEPAQAARLHYAESIFGGQFVSGSPRTLDIGSGAGFPGVPLAIVKPELQLTALESNHKKAVFLQEAVARLNIANVSVARARLEDFDWSGFELIVSRALDRAEAVFRSIIERIKPPQALMLYAAPSLLAVLRELMPAAYAVETHPIPLTENRFIGLFGQKARDADTTESK
ncbi:MAG TPA: 16S rRNA (guanine(527)-N(7))-methyltransferase RsmG [Blastocatellia bacterium]|nr:16S rRNA (guanine(527)-N(7))-methyltransferase RsmG [Blastocatellia bacterium]